MGDNRDHSLDSRYFGFIPYENVVGTPMVVYWSWDTNLPMADIGDKLSTIRFSRIGTIIK
jgi:signal peptidase I